MRVDLYTKPSCGYCVSTKALLNQKNIPFTEYTIGDQVSKEDVQKRITDMGLSVQVRTVPQIFYIDKNNITTYIGGYSDLVSKQAILGS